MEKKKKINVTVIGGGTGSSAVLNSLKMYREIDIDVVVSMADDGGSNAVIRDEFGLLPLSDLRKSIIALSPWGSDETLRKLFTYRFSEGEGLSGHTMGNLMMTALSKITSGEKDAIKEMTKLFQVEGRILPVTYQDYTINAKYTDGSVLDSEHLIDEPNITDDAKIIEFWTDPKVTVDQEVVESITSANFIVIGPGDIYTTTLATLIVKGVSDALRESDAEIIYITNLMSKKGQSRHMTQLELVKLMEGYIERPVDHIVMNSEEIPNKILDYYRKDGEHILEDDLGRDERVIRENLVADEIFQRDKGDDLVRSMVRHDIDRLGWVLYRLMKEETFDKLD